MNSVLRPAPCELETDHYPFVTDVLLRFSDLDINAHVNNVSIANLFEEGRLKFALHYRKVTFNGLVECEEKVLIVSSLISYIGEVFYPDPVKEYLGIADIGSSSFTQTCLMTQYGRPVAHSRVTLVRAEGGQSKPLSDALRQSLSKLKVTWPV